MRKVVLSTKSEVVLSSIPKNVPIFLKKNGEFKGMIVYTEEGYRGYLGKNICISGNHSTRESCAEHAVINGFELYIE